MTSAVCTLALDPRGDGNSGLNSCAYVCVFVRVLVLFISFTQCVWTFRTPTESLSNSTHLVRLMGVLLAGEELRTILRGVALGDEVMACLIKSA